MPPFRRMSLALCVPILCSFFLLMDCQEVSTFTMQYQILEEVQPGTVLGRLSEEIGRTEGSWGTFQLLQSSAVFPIQMDSRDGLLSTTGRLNREQLCHHRDPCVLSFSVLAAQYFTLIHVEIHVLDINDNGPRFPQVALELEISESVSLQTRIPLGRALDPDAGSNAFCSYFLSPSEHFALEVTAGSDGTQQAELVVIKEVDRELYSSFELVLTAVDHGVPPRSGTTVVTVHVLDSNDNSPTFAQGSVSVVIREDALPGTFLINLTATDPDQGPNGEIEYSFSKHVSEEVLRTFAVERHTGSVLLQQSLDYEKNSAYELEVQARDQGANSIPAHCKLFIRVLDVNDNTPDIQVTWAKQAAVLSEAQPQGSFVALVTAFDPDSGRNGQVDCYIRQGEEHFALKRFSPGSYMLLTNAPLDRESWTQHHLTLLVQDRGTPLLATTRHFTVHVSDVNDNMPYFETNHYHVSIAENSEPPSVLVMVRAQDADSGLNGKVVYRIPDPLILEWLAIDASTGEIRAHAAFDAEKITSLDFLVIAEDMGQPQLSANVSVTVTVLDVNDNSPVVIKPELEGGRASVTALVDPDTGHVLVPKEEGSSELAASLNAPLLLTILATDADSGLNGTLLYSILSGNEAGICVLDPQSGQLYLNGSNASSLLGREWDLVISVSDRGPVPLSTRFLVKITFKRHCERMPDSFPVSQPLSPSVVTGICLLGLLAISLVGLGLIMSLCKREKHGSMAYNCREAEQAYSQQQPKKPPKPIQKADIHVVPVLRQEDAQQPPAEIENPSEAAWLKALGVPCHMTPTLYRTLRNQRNSSSLAEQAPCYAQRFRSPSARDVQPTDKKLLDSIFWPKDHLSEKAKAGPEEAPSRQHILRSLVRLSLAALAEQGPGGQLAMESAPVQQISQLLSLLHQGQVQPKPNHRGNKYTAKNASCRNPNSNVEDLITKEGSGCEHHDWELLGKELGNLLDCPSGLDLDQLNVEDPAWMARLSFPISTDYKDNIVSPGALPSPLSEETTGRDEPHTFATFGKAAGHKPNSEEPRLSSTFLSEMNTLFEKILAQKVSPQVD
ncbi:protocadherin-12 isoform X1 [Podarcis lilfordi]|uniref:Protocadherin-12 isoform X1 n=1 Tax=Podarcis lilfordi TaxID=74358 RepID=A0AA35KMJ8_9SAUR|nr:protocadherin-12 isoform X1 [Podarcis lilfordi]